MPINDSILTEKKTAYDNAKIEYQHAKRAVKKGKLTEIEANLEEKKRARDKAKRDLKKETKLASDGDLSTSPDKLDEQENNVSEKQPILPEEQPASMYALQAVVTPLMFSSNTSSPEINKNKCKYKFQPDSLIDHFERHKNEFKGNYKDPESYENGAIEVIVSGEKFKNLNDGTHATIFYKKFHDNSYHFVAVRGNTILTYHVKSYEQIEKKKNASVISESSNQYIVTKILTREELMPSLSLSAQASALNEVVGEQLPASSSTQPVELNKKRTRRRKSVSPQMATTHDAVMNVTETLTDKPLQLFSFEDTKELQKELGSIGSERNYSSAANDEKINVSIIISGHMLDEAERDLNMIAIRAQNTIADANQYLEAVISNANQAVAMARQHAALQIRSAQLELSHAQDRMDRAKAAFVVAGSSAGKQDMTAPSLTYRG